MFLGINLTDMNMYVHTKTCTWISAVALFITAATSKQSGCPSLDRQINKLR